MFGIGAGKIELTLAATNYQAGDTINGNARLTINSPIKARGVIATFWGERQSTSIRGGKSSSSKQILFKVEKILDGEKEYQKTSEPLNYDFALQIPPNALHKIDAGNDMMGRAFDVLQQFAQGNTRFYVEAKLDVPFGIDVSKKIEVFISQNAVPQVTQ
ncbi:MAG TPA: hypothetical protein VJH23_00215 [archaeon]|nr:hypothetical protein [archaeon]